MHERKSASTLVRRLSGAAVGLLLAAVQAAAPAAGTEVALELDPADGTELGSPSLRIEEGSLHLALDEAIALALERNLSLVVERHLQSESRFGLEGSHGIFDLMATVDLTAFDETSPAASNLDGAEVQTREQQRLDMGISRLLASGGTVSAEWSNSRFETNSIFATLNPNYSIDFDVSFSQPLLRDQGRLATRRQIRIARTSLDISREGFEIRVMGVIQDVENAYWGLIEAQEQLKVAVESLDLARQLHEQNKIRVEVGTLAPLELVQSEAGVATRQEEIIRARFAVGDAEDLLRQLLNLNAEGLWDLPIVAETNPRRDMPAVDVDQAVAYALAERPSIRSKKLELRDLELDVEYFQNQRLPRLDLSVTYGLNGIGGPVTDRLFPSGEILGTAPGGYGDALDQIGSTNFEGWSAALNLLLPVQNRAAKAQSSIAQVQADRGRAELRELELQVITEVRRAARAVGAAAEAVESAGVSRRLAERNLDAEEKRYENGMSTSYQVLEIQEDLAAARSREVAAITGYRKALVGFYRSVGTLLDESGVTIGSGEV